jgi:periplasmic protein TonB
MRRSFTIVSIAVHAVVVGAVFVAQLLAVGALPEPRTPLTFVGAIPIRVIEIPLPAPQRSAAAGAPATASAQPAAPIDAPNEIRPDTVSDRRGAVPGDAVGVEHGIGSGALFGTAEAMPAAPPPPPAPPQTPVRLHPGMQPPRKIVNVDPIYPRVAQQARIEGTVILDTVIDVDGHVTAVRVLRSIPLLDQAAIDAVRGWTFTPTLLNGVPVPVALTVTVRFALSAR